MSYPERNCVSGPRSETRGASITPVDNVATHKDNCGHSKRVIGRLASVALVFNFMVGSGIFVSPQLVSQHAPSTLLCLAVWLSGGIITLMLGLCYVELSRRVPMAGGSYIYVLVAYGPMHDFFGPLLAFLCSWVHVFVLEPCFSSGMSDIVAELLTQAFLGCRNEQNAQHYDGLIVLFSLIVLWLVAVVACQNTKVLINISNMLCFVKLLIIVVIVAMAVWKSTASDFQPPDISSAAKSIKNERSLTVSIFLAIFDVTWAFNGWDVLNYKLEELTTYSLRHLAKIVIFAISTVTICYMLVITCFQTILYLPKVQTHQSSIDVFADSTMGRLSWIIKVVAYLSLVANPLVHHIASSRKAYVAAREGHLAQILSTVHHQTGSCVAAIILNAMLSSIFVVLGTTEKLMNLFNFGIIISQILVVSSLVVLKRKIKIDDREDNGMSTGNHSISGCVPLLLVVLLLIILSTILIVNVSVNSKIGYVFVIAFIMLGVFVYSATIYVRRSNPWARKFTPLVQKLFLLHDCRI